MKIYTLILICILFIQCDDKKSSSVDKLKSERNKLIIENCFAEKIQKYYANGEGSNLKLEINKSDSINDLIFKDNENFPLMLIKIPKKNTSNSKKQILFTDINNDELQDIIINVHREGGWGGGNVFDNEIFIFKNEKNNFILKSANNSRTLTDCKFGHFSLRNIENDKLTGISYCYAPEDGHCCPSLKYETLLKFKNWKLEHFESKEIN